MMISPSDLTIGDRITFRSPTRDGCRTATRIINGFNHCGLPTVAYFGWPQFVVAPHELIELVPEQTMLFVESHHVSRPTQHTGPDRWLQGWREHTNVPGHQPSRTRSESRAYAAARGARPVFVTLNTPIRGGIEVAR